MKKFFLLLSVLAVFAGSNAAADGRQPLLVLDKSEPFGRYKGIEKTDWKLGGLNPMFVLYDDGLVIFKKPSDDITLFSVQLTEERMNDLLARFDLNGGFAALEETFEVSRILDQPVYVITTWPEGKAKTVRVFGDLEDDEEARAKAPAAFLTIFDEWRGFDPKDALVWPPELMEVNVFPYEHAEGETVAWPQGWADLKDSRTKDVSKMFGHESYNIYLDGAHREEFEKLIAQLTDKQAVFLSGKKMYISPQRYCLPGEERWRN